MEEALHWLAYSKSECTRTSLKSVITICIQAVENAGIVFIVWLPLLG